MGLVGETYTGVSVTAGTQITSTGFNKLAITAESLFAGVQFYAAQTQTTYLSPARTFAQGSDWTLPFDTMNFDSSTFWNANQKDRLTVPPGINYLMIWFYVRYPFGNWTTKIYKNGVTVIASYLVGTSSNKYQDAAIVSPMIAVTAGDYFQGTIQVPGSGTATWDQKFSDGYSGSLVTYQPILPSFGLLTVEGFAL